MNDQLPSKIISAAARPFVDQFSRRTIDRSNRRRQVFADQQLRVVGKNGDPSRKCSCRERPSDLRSLRIDLDNLTGIFERHVNATAIVCRDDSVRLVKDRHRRPTLARVAINKHDGVVVVNGDGDLVRLTNERDAFGVMAHFYFAKHFVLCEVDESDRPAVSITARQERSV